MKNKIFAVILTVCMLFSTLGMTALANDAEEVEILSDEAVIEEIELASEEDVELQASTVTATLSGSNIDGATNVALSIRLVVEFPTALPANTDVSGITLTGGTQDVTLTITGTSTTAAFSKLTIDTPVLETATTYTLNVPALGSNAEASFSFTTVQNGYIAKEDYDGRYTGFAAQKQTGATAATAAGLLDTDSDGVKDSFRQGDYSTLFFPSGIEIGDTDELMIEVRTKYTNTSYGAKYYNAADGTFNNSGDGNNYGLLSFRGASPTAGNNNGHVLIKHGLGTVGYGGNNAAGGSYDTGFKIYVNTWYTFRVAFDSKVNQYTVYVFDDNGNAAQGPFMTTRWNGHPIKPLYSVYFSYNPFINTTTDYVYVWRNGEFKDITATYGKNLNLADAVDVPGSSFITTLKFENDVTLDDLSVMKINNGATLTPALVDSKTVALTISNLAYSTSYILNIPQFGNNKAKTFAFTTESAPVPLENGDYAFTLADGTAVTELSAVRADSTIEYVVDEALITATPDAYKNVMFEDTLGNVIEADCSLGANGKYVAYPKKGLEYGTTYTFKWPTSQVDENGKTRYKMLTFTTEAAPFAVVADPAVISGSTATATALITDNTGLSNKIKAMLVVYNAEGRIIKVTAQDITLSAGDNTVNLTAVASGASDAKFYIWGGPNGMSNIIAVQ